MGGVAAGALFVAVGTAVGALLNTPVAGMRRPMGSPSLAVSLLGAIGIGPLDWLACAVTSPLFVWLARRCPINRRRWMVNLPLHLTAAAVMVLLVGVMYYIWVMPVPGASRGGCRRGSPVRC